MHYSIVAASAGGLTDFKELPIVPAKFWLTALVFLSLSFLSACTGGEGGNQSNLTATAEAVSAEVVATATSIPVPTATTALPTTTVTPVDGLAAPTSASMVEPLPYAIDMPPGFTIHYYAKNVPNARSMALSPAGTLFVGTRSAGRVYAVLDPDQDYVADEVVTIARDLNMPNGVAFRNNSLYVAEVDRILRFDDIEAHLDSPPQPVVLSDAYPSDGWHGWKYLRFGPDGDLYVPVGAPCNVCDVDDSIYGTITRLKVDGSDMRVVARGVRNSVGFDWHPQTGDLWFTDNGRDELGDDVPPDELNHLSEPGLHFGFPYCHGGTVPDPQFGSLAACEDFTPPAMPLGPHVAALGVRFYTGDMFPQEYRDQVLIAEHGSWNRSVPIGYRVSLVRLEGDEAVSYEVFAEGWLNNGQVLGRPVDLLVMPDGSLLVSDDTANVIYRITYEP